MNFKKIIKLFRDGNCIVFGLRGSGKDMLTSNVVVRRKLPYISNVDYGGDFSPLELDKLDCGKNTYLDFINGSIKKYQFPYSDGTDVYLSDAGVYFPAQYVGDLNKRYAFFPTFFALSRHLGQCNVHVNVQSLNRVWDKIREQSDTYILCRKCIVLFHKIVFQWVTVYDFYDSAVIKRPPFSLTPKLFSSKEERENIRMQKTLYDCNYGHIRPMFLCYINKSSYDTRIFKTLLGGDSD